MRDYDTLSKSWQRRLPGIMNLLGTMRDVAATGAHDVKHIPGHMAAKLARAAARVPAGHISPRMRKALESGDLEKGLIDTAPDEASYIAARNQREGTRRFTHRQNGGVVGALGGAAAGLMAARRPNAIHAAAGAVAGAAAGYGLGSGTAWARNRLARPIDRFKYGPSRKSAPDGDLAKAGWGEYGPIDRSKQSSSVTRGVIQHGFAATGLLAPVSAPMGGIHAYRANKLRQRLGGSPEYTPRDLKGRTWRNVGGFTGASGGAVIGGGIGGLAGAALSRGNLGVARLGASIGSLAGGVSGYHYGHRQVRDSQIYTRDFANKAAPAGELAKSVRLELRLAKNSL